VVNGWQRGLLVGAALGFAGGLILGLLVAPAPGFTTRRRLVRGARSLSERASSAVGATGERLRKGLRRES
jgi:hypothetical protein